MQRSWRVLGGSAVVAIGLACGAHAPAPESGGAVDPGPLPVEAPASEEAAVVPAGSAEDSVATGGELRCLPFATCGCFQEPECVAGRVREDGFTFDIVGGSRDGETGHLSQDCPDETTDQGGCVDYVDPAMICARMRPATVRSAKYLCSMDHIHAGWQCAFRDGECTVR